MTICAQSLSSSEKAKFQKLLKGKTAKEIKQINKKLSKIVQTAIAAAGGLESSNIKRKIADSLKETFPLD